MQFLSERKWSQNYVLIETFHISLSLFQTLDKRDFEEDLWGKECEYFDCWRPVRLGLRAIERSLWEKKDDGGLHAKEGVMHPTHDLTQKGQKLCFARQRWEMGCINWNSVKKR